MRVRVQYREVLSLEKFKIITPLTQIIGIGALLYLLELFLVEGYKNGFGDSFHIVFVTLPACGMIFLVIYFFAWVHYQLLLVSFRNNLNERLLGVARLGTFVLVGLVELFILITLFQINSTYSLVVLYIPPMAFLSFIVVFLIAKFWKFSN